MKLFIIISFLSSLIILTVSGMHKPEETPETFPTKLIKRLSSKTRMHRRAKSDSHLSSSFVDPRTELAKDYVKLAKDAIQERKEAEFDELIQKINDLDIKEQLMQQWQAVSSPTQSSDGSFLRNAALDAIQKKDSVKFGWTKDRITNSQEVAQLQSLWDIEKKYIPEAQAAIRASDETAFKAALQHITDRKMKGRLERRWSLRHDKNIITSHRLSASKGSVTMHRQNPS